MEPNYDISETIENRDLLPKGHRTARLFIAEKSRKSLSLHFFVSLGYE